jgi:hypothetical protein
MLNHRLLNYTKLVIFLLLIGNTANAFTATQSDQKSINFQDIKEYAVFANATYQTVPEIRKLSSTKNYTLTHHNNIPEIEIFFYLITNDVDKTQNIAIRGTANIENAIIDVELELTTDKHTGARLHSGFLQAAQGIYKDIKPHLKPGYVINTTGHSLGGATAVILAMYLDIDNFKIGKVMTFGQPKVTNITGANKFKHLNIIRVVTPKDLVPLVPPFDPLDLNNLDIYWHLGKEIILLPDDTYAMLEGLNSMIRATKFTQEPLTEDNLQHHQMTQYIDMINKKIPIARLVTFENSLNIFNWFGNEKK